MAKRLKSRINTKIVGATMVTIFSLASVFSGTYAWFAMQKSQTVTAAAFEVVNNSTASMGTVQLCKFVYEEDGHGFINYIQPRNGSVETYNYNTERKQFENVNISDQELESYKRIAQVMNMYDPAGYEIDGLRDLLCNAVYIVPVTGSSLSGLRVYANIIPTEPEPEGSSSSEESSSEEESSSSESSSSSSSGFEYTYINLSNYVDFDVYTDADIAAADTAHSGGDEKYYYPSHIPSSEAEPSDSYTKLFYKIDYLSAQNGRVHKHFYGGSAVKLLISNNLTFSSNSENVYINVNYSPSQLERYARELVIEKLWANYDFYFSIEL